MTTQHLFKNFTGPVLSYAVSGNKKIAALKLFVTAILLDISLGVSGQVATNYTFSAANGTYSTALTGQTTIFPAGWSALVANVPLPFVFYFNGKGYSSVWVNSNGYITFGATPPLASANNPISNNNGFDGSVSGFGLNNSGNSACLVDANNANAVVYGTQISGGNTVFVIQWTTAWREPSKSAGATENINFQIRLIQNTNVVEIMYGATTANINYTYINLWSPVVGIGGATTADFNIRSKTAAATWSTINTTAGATPSAYVHFGSLSPIPTGLTMDWTPATLPSACSGTPPVPTAVASTGIACSSVALSLAGLPNATGLTYQWFQSPTGLAGSFSSISGATNASYTTTPTAAAYYQCQVSCGASSVTSTPVAVGRESSCPIAPTYLYNGWYYNEILGQGTLMTSFSILPGVNTCGTSFADMTASASGYAQTYQTGTCANYIDLTFLPPIKLQAGASYNGGTVTSGWTNPMNVVAWIDFNDDGLFTGTGEQVASVGGVINSSSGNLNITIPAVGSGAFYGLHRMRVRAAFSLAITSATANMGTYGNAKDYMVNILPPNQTITASPIASPASICAPGAAETLTAITNISTGTATGTAYTYTWSGPSGFGSSVTSTTNTTSFTPTSTAFSGVYTVIPTSDGARACVQSTVNVIVAASVASPNNPPASGFTISGNTYQGAGNITFTPYSTIPDGYLVVATNSATAPANPIDGTTYATGLAGSFGANSVVISGSVFGSAPPYSTTALNSNSLYYVYVYPFNIDCSGPKYYTGYPVLVGNTLTTCIAPPTGLTATAPAGTTVNLGWTAAANGGNAATVITPATYTYTIHAYLDAGLTTEAIGYPVTGITGTTYVASGLGVGTTYFFVVTSNAPGATCGANSNTASNTTTCSGAASIPLLQNFDGSALGSLSPNCWTGNAGQLVSGANVAGGVYRNGGYVASPFSPHSGLNYYLFLGSAYISAVTYANQWLMSPGFSLTPGTYNVRFWYMSNSTWNGLNVQYSTTGTIPANTSASMAGATAIGTPLGSFSAGSWTLYSGTMTIGSAGTYYVGIDAIMAPTTCIAMAVEDFEICKVPNVTVSNGTAPYCATATVNLSSAGSTDINQYSWSGPGSFTSSLANPVVSGLGAGTYTYSLTGTSDPITSGYGGYCSSGPSTTTFTVNPGPSAITGGGVMICPGATVTLNDATSPGTWSSSVPGVATVGTSGIVTGVAAGTTTISYTTSCGGSATTVISVNYAPGPILGNLNVCNGLTSALSNVIGGGTWISDNSLVAAVGSSSGIVTGMGVGTANIIYSLGSCTSTAVATVVPALPLITGTAAACPTSTTVLSIAATGGAWSSSNANATVTSGTVTGVTPGTATITYTSGVCYTTKDVTVSPLPTAAPVSNAPICNGGTVALTANPGGSTTIYAWSGPALSSPTAANPTATPTTTSIYSLTASNSIAGCPSSGVYTVSVTVTTAPTAAPATSSPICNGGTVVLAANAFGSTTTYLWAGPGLASSTDDITSATPPSTATYSLTVTNGTANPGCSNTYTTVVVVNPIPTASPTNSGPICNGGTVTLSAVPSGGATGYTWSGPNLSSTTAQNPTATPVTTSTYSLVVNNGVGSGCTPTTVYTTTVTVNPAPTAAPVNSGTICNGGTVTLTANPANGASAYAWSGPFLSSTIAQNPTATPTTTSTYSLTVSSGASSGCSPATIYTTTVTVNPKPIAAPANNGYICQGGTVNLSANPSGGATVFTWSGASLSSTIVANPTATPGTTTTYSLTVSDGSGNPGCAPATIYTTTVTVNSIPGAAPANDGPICVGGTANLSANPSGGATTYTWSGVSLSSTIAQNPTATPVVTGVYSLTVSDGSGKPGCAPATVYTTAVTVNAIPTASPANSGIICNGGTVSLMANPANGASIYSWSGPFLSSSTDQNPTATPTVSSTYSLTVSSGVASGCSPATVYTTTVTVNPTPTAAPFNDGYICQGGTTTLTANPSGGATVFTWSGTSLSSTTAANPTATPNTTATYSLTVSDGSGNPGCSPATIYTTAVIVNATPVAAPANDGHICVGGTVNLSANPSGGATTYTWSGVSLSSTTVQNPTATPVVTGVYSLTVSDGSGQPGCAPATVYTTVVTVNAIPTASPANSGIICNGGTVSLIANPANGASLYSWSGPALSSPTDQNPTATPTVTSTYSLTVSSGANSGCSPATIYTTTVTVNPTPTASPVNNGYICQGGTVTLTANPSGGATVFTWSGTSLSSATAANPTATPNTTATYSLTVSDGSGNPGCSPATVYTTAVTVNSTPVAAPTNDGYICAGGTVNLSANPSGGATTYTWSGTSLSSSIAQNPTATPTVTKVYSLTVSDGSGKPGCSPSTVYTTSVTVSPAPTLASASNNGPICIGATLNLSANTPSNVAGYSWSGPVTITNPATATPIVPAATAAANGVYTVVVDNGPASGCARTYTTSATINALPTITAITPSTLNMCVGTQLTLAAGTATGSGTLTSYNWAGPGGYTSTTATNSAILTPATTAAGGVYSLSVTYSGAGCTSNPVASTPVAVNDLPVLTDITVSPSALCVNDIATLTGTGASGAGSLVSYNWTGPNSYSSSTAASVQNYTIPNVLAAGVYSLSVTYTGTGCTSARVGSNILTVNALPNVAPITGIATVCPSATTNLNNTTTGGIWSSTTTGIATVGSTGVVAGVSAGTSAISYTVTNVCGPTSVLKVVTVNPSPDAGSITGATSVCPAANTTLSNTAVGGLWSSLTPGVAIINSGGVVTGISSGTSTISYTVNNSCGAAATSVVMTVTPTPNVDAISGTATVCPTATTTLSNTTPGGVWSSTAPWIATIGSSGVVTGVATGTAPISYTVTNICGASATAITAVTVNAAPIAGVIAGSPVICNGSYVTLVDLAPGGTWSSGSPGIAVVDASGKVTGVNPGTLVITYTVTNSCGAAVATLNMLVNVANIPVVTIVSDLGNIITKGSVVTFTANVTGMAAPLYQWQLNGIDIMGATSMTYTSSTIQDGNSISCKVYGNGPCDFESFNVITMTVVQPNDIRVVATADNAISVTPNPSKGEFTVKGVFASKTDEEVLVEVTNMLGQVVYTNTVMAQSGNINEHIKLDNIIANGMYLLHLRAATSGNVVFHLVIEQ